MVRHLDMGSSYMPCVEHELILGDSAVSVVATALGQGRIFLIAVDDLHVGTFGTIVRARREVSMHGRETCSIVTLLGDRGNRLPELWARMVLETSRRDATDVVFCFGLPKAVGRSATEGKALCRALSQKVDELMAVTS